MVDYLTFMRSSVKSTKQKVTKERRESKNRKEKKAGKREISIF